MENINQIQTSVLIRSKYEGWAIKIERGAVINDRGDIQLIEGLRPASIGVTAYVELNLVTNGWFNQSLKTDQSMAGIKSSRISTLLAEERRN